VRSPIFISLWPRFRYIWVCRSRSSLILTLALTLYISPQLWTLNHSSISLTVILTRQSRPLPNSDVSKELARKASLHLTLVSLWKFNEVAVDDTGQRNSTYRLNPEQSEASDVRTDEFGWSILHRRWSTPRPWNNLPLHLRDSELGLTFLEFLKTEDALVWLRKAASSDWFYHFSVIYKCT